MSGLSSVAYLYLNNNQLTGNIPDLSGLTALYHLRLSHNQLTGEVPDSLGGTSVRYLHLNNNQLTGQIPDLSNLYLLDLDLSTNQLTGEIPATLAQIIDLEVLLLDDNQLTGEIPAVLGNLNLLTRTRFANNALTGCVPHAFPFRTLLTAAEVRPGVPAQDFIAVDGNGDGDTDDAGDVPGLNLPFCTLSTLTLSGTTLAPTFAPGTTTYTAESTGTSTTVTVTQNESSDRLSIGKGATSYSAGDPIPLEVGSNLITIEVTPTDSRLLKQTYTVDVFRAGSVQTDREALIALYNSAGGSGWTASVGWDTTQALGMWHGVTLDGDGRVVGLALAGNNLSGTVPASLSTLTKLASLDLSGNQLRGAIPPRLRGLSELTTLDLSANQFSGLIPPRLGDLALLTSLDLSANGLSGAIPPGLGGITGLTSLDLSANGLSGAIPPELGDLSSLDALYLHDNQLSGAIPPELGDLSSLGELSLRDNRLSGPIPPELGNLLALRFARFADNSFTGCVPHGLRYLVAAAEFASGVPAHDFTRDANGDGDTADPGDIDGLALPFCGLSELILGGLTLAPAFDDGTVAYIASAGHSVTSTTVTATLNNSADGVSITKGTDTYMNGDAVPLAVGVNVITIGAIAADGTTAPHTYSVAVARAPNMPPLFDEGPTATRSVDENTAANQPIGDPLTATDANNDTLTYSLDTASDAFFDIDSDGQLLTEAGLDHEARNSYSVNVSVSDGKASDGTASTSTDSTITVTITVENVDEPPLIVGRASVTDYPENSATTTAVGSYTATDPEGEAVTGLSLMGRDAGDFDFSNTGVLTFKVSPDYEMKHDYEVTLNASADGERGIQTGTLDVTVTVTNVNERPVVDGTTAITHAENEGTALANARYSATDPERANIIWSVGGIDKGFFAISSGGELSFAAEPDFDIKGDHNRDNTYEVTVQATEEDDGDRQTRELTGTLAVTVTLTDVNEPPVVRRRSGTGAFSIVENSGTDVGRFVATDPEGGGVTWSLATTGDHGRFEIGAANGALSFKEAPDYESSDLGLGPDKAYTVTVQATEVDDGDTQTLELTGDLDVTVTITNENEPPVVRRSSGTGPFSIVENSGTDVGAFEATDPEGQGVTWSLATTGDHGRFEINAANGALSFKEAPDYESSDLGSDEAYNVTVRATEEDDGDPQTDELTGDLAVIVRITNVNEPPTVTGDAAPSVPENTTAVATYSATDPEGVAVTWSLQGGAGVFMITSAGALSFTTAPNYEVKSSYTVTVRASDGVNTTNHPVTVTVTDVDEDEGLLPLPRRPFIGIGYIAAFEVGKGDAVQSPMWVWARSMSLSGPWADITVAATAATYVPVGADRDHYLRVTASYNDGHGQGRKTLQATSELPTLPDIPNNRPPTFPSPLFTGGATGLSVDENATAGTVVGVAPQATDFEGGSLTYSLAVTGFTTDLPFEINATSRQIRVASGAALDHEDQETYSVTVTAEDEYTATGTATFNITIEDVNERPVAVFDIPLATAEDTATTFAVLANDTDPDDGDTLTVSITSQPSRGRVVADTTTQLVTYTPAENDHGTYTFMYTARDDDPVRTLSSLPAQVTVTVNPVNDRPTFPAAPVERSVPENARPGANVGVPVTATDVDGDLLGYRIPGAPEFEIDEQTGQITVAAGAALNVALSPYSVTVEADDGSGELNATAIVEVTIMVTARPVIIITGGGGGGGGGGPSPSEVDFEWTVKHDIEELDGGNDWPTGLWSDGETLWIAENGQGADDEVYAYDRASGERLSEREFTLAETNRAPRGFWSDGVTVWVSDSGRERLFAYRLADGERLEEREFALAAGNSDARGIWSDHETMWVLDGRADRLFAYALASGELLAEYALDSANSDPHGLWSDGVTVWVSDHGAKRLFAYRLEGEELTRNRDEEFGELSQASNNSPRGIWSDGDFMYVADESDDRVYTYNMPDAIDARLASLTFSGVDIGEFDPARTDYEGSGGEGVTETVVTAEAMQRRTDVAIDPPDADGDDANGHQVALAGLAEITVTVTSADGSRKKVYRVRFPEAGWDPARDPWPHCLRGAVSEGFSLAVYEGGSVEELVSCADSRGIVAFYALHDGAYVSYILGAPDFVNAGFLELFPDGLPPVTPLVAGSNGPPSADPFGDDLEDGGQQPWPECLRGDIAAGFSLVVYEGGSVDELEACARSLDVTALYTLREGEFVSYILGAPELVNQPFRDLFASGLPSVTPLVARSEGQP